MFDKNRYTITFKEFTVTVVADNEDDAIDKAVDLANDAAKIQVEKTEE